MADENQITDQEFYNDILNNVDNYSDKEVSNYWLNLESFLKTTQKKDIEKVKKLLFDITEKFTTKGAILAVVGFEFVLPRLSWFNQEEVEKIANNLIIL